MTWLAQAWAWLVDPAHWTGPGGALARLVEHLGYTALTLLVAAVIAVPLGVLIGHTGRGRGVVVPTVGALRALPTLGLVTLLALGFGIGITGPLIALVLLALPPLLAGAYAGVEAVDRRAVDAAHAVGMTRWQVVTRVELPLALPLVIGGLRSAGLQVVATWTVAAYLPLGGLGRLIFDAIPVRDYPRMLAGSLLVIVLALVVDALLALLQRAVVPAGVRAGRRRPVRSAPRRPTRAMSRSTSRRPAARTRDP